MQQPLVSVVTTCYQHAPFLPDYFGGLLAQTYPNIELVFLDDGSADDSWDVAKQYENALRAQLSRVVMLRQENQGMFAAIKRAVDEATGEFVCVLESDDYYLPTKLQENIAHFQRHPDLGVVHSDTDYVYAERIVPSYWRAVGKKVPHGSVFSELLSDGNFVKTCTTCIRSRLLKDHVSFKRYASRGYLMADLPMCLDLAVHAKFGYIDKPLARYRVREESASHSKDSRKMAKFWRSAVQIRIDYLRDHGLIGDPVSEDMFRATLGFAYEMREAGVYRDALATYCLALNTWGWRLEVGKNAAKLVPHWAARQIKGFGRRVFSSGQHAASPAI